MAKPQAAETGAARTEMFARIATALGRSRITAPPAPPRVDEAIARLAGAGDDLPALFAAGAEAVGMKVQRLAAAEVLDTVQRLLEEHHAKRIAVAMHDGQSLVDHLRATGLEVLTPQTRADFDHQFDFDAGITDVHAALAETGTLICHSDAAHSRGPSLVPPVHIAIVRRSDIVPDMIDYWAMVRGAGALPSSIAFITGPSKTADIEGILIIGVHGPQHVHVLLVHD